MVKKISMVLGILIAIVVAFNLISQIADALKSGERLSKEAEQVYKLEAKNKELKRKLAEIKSPEFIEEQARDKLGLGKKGETVVIIPEEKIKQVLGASGSGQEPRLLNWLGWWKLFFK